MAALSLSLHAWRWRLRARSFRRSPRLPAILLYHSIGARERDPLRLALPAGRFAEHIAWLARTTTVLPLAEFVERGRRGTLPDDAVAVTFDDGYVDNLEIAAPLLRRHAVPATIFVATDYIGAEEEGWWEELDAILLESPVLPPRFAHGDFRCSLEARLDPRRRHWTVLEPAGTLREKAFLAASAHAARLGCTARRHLLAALRAWAGRAPSVRAGRGFAGWDDLRRAASGGLLSIGAHTRSHPMLAAQTRAEQRAEIAGSLAEVRVRLGRAPAGFAYPFGTYHDFSSATVRTARAAGAPFACANMTGAFSSPRDDWQLPRLLVWDWPVAELAARLGR